MALEIIGPGFGRTGTNSLRLALEQLGFGPCHHMFEVRDNPDLIKPWQAAGDGAQVNWQAVFANYRAQVDWPGAHYWRELIAAFPNAKVVLSVRDPNKWFDSIQATIAAFIAARGDHNDPHANATAEMVHHTLIQPTFGDGFTDRAHAIDVFERHNQEVKDAVPADNLLVYDVRQGWGPLCGFLGVEVPDTDFPRTNSSQEFIDRNKDR